MVYLAKFGGYQVGMYLFWIAQISVQFPRIPTTEEVIAHTSALAHKDGRIAEPDTIFTLHRHDIDSLNSDYPPIPLTDTTALPPNPIIGASVVTGRR